MFQEQALLKFYAAIKNGVSTFVPVMDSSESEAPVRRDKQSLRFLLPFCWLFLVALSYGFAWSEMNFQKVMQAEIIDSPFSVPDSIADKKTVALVGEVHL